MRTFSEYLVEAAAPGQEDWILKNKAEFIKQYGKEKGLQILYTTTESVGNTTMGPITIKHKNVGAHREHEYVFHVNHTDVNKPSALKIHTINGDRRVSMNQVSNAAYRKGMDVLKKRLTEDDSAVTTGSVGNTPGPDAAFGKIPSKEVKKPLRRKAMTESLKVGDRVVILKEGYRHGRVVEINEEDGSLLVDPNPLSVRESNLPMVILGLSEVEKYVSLRDTLLSLKQDLIDEACKKAKIAEGDEEDEDEDDEDEDEEDDEVEKDDDNEEDDEDDDSPENKKNAKKKDDGTSIDEGFYSSPKVRDSTRKALMAVIKKKPGVPTVKKNPMHEAIRAELDALEDNGGINAAAIKNLAIRLSMNSSLEIAEAMQKVAELVDARVVEEGVEVSHSNYEFTHGAKPRGHGNWIFSPHKDVDLMKHKKGEDYFHHQGNYSEAKAKAASWAKAAGHTQLHVAT